MTLNAQANDSSDPNSEVRQARMRATVERCCEPNLDTVPLLLHVFPSFDVGGSQTRFAAIANHFGREFRHVVVSLTGNIESASRLSPDVPVIVPAVHAPKGAMLSNVVRFRGFLRRWQPQTLVTHNWGTIEWALANWPRITRHIHIEDGFGPEERSEQLQRRVLIRRVALSRSTVVLPSRNLWRLATTNWGLSPERVRYVPNGIDVRRFSASTRGSHDPGRIPVIGTVAVLRAEKNIARLLRAFALLEQPAQLTIVGDGPERASLQSLAASLGIAERVQFAGHQVDPAPLYAGFDVFALSSDTEQMPLSVMEAMASGLPVAATDVGDVSIMLAEPNAPFVVRLDDAQLAKSISRLLQNEPLRKTIGLANRDKASREFDQDSMFRTYGALLRGEELQAAA